MRKIKCLIVDDEPLAREGLAKYIQQVEVLELVATAKNATDAQNLLHQHEIELMFLDIEMPQISGLNLLQTLHKAPWVIFTTAYAEFALEGYRFNTIDYLVKPISFERFLQAINKSILVLKGSGQKVHENHHLFIKVDKQLVRLLLDDILYIEGMQNYIAIFTEKERLVTMLPMKNLFEMLPEGEFIQVHKSYIVAKKKVDRITENTLILGTCQVPLSRRLREEVIGELAGDNSIKKGLNI